MSIELDTLADEDLCFALAGIDPANPTWQGHAIIWADADAICDSVATKLHAWLATADQSTAIYQRVQDTLIHLGGGKPFSEREVQLIPAGFGKWVQEHTFEIVIGVAALAAIVTIVVCTAGAGAPAAGAIATAGAGALTGEKSPPPQSTPTLSSSPSLIANKPLTTQPPKWEPPSHQNPFLPKDPLNLFPEQKAPPLWTQFALAPKEIPPPFEPKNNLLPKGYITFVPENLPPPKESMRFETPGPKYSQMAIGGINGMKTPFDGSTHHAAYLSKLVGGLSISWVHNQSHGVLGDLGEILATNYLGFSPNTAQLLTETWKEFHTENKDRPNAKFLQFCHSQGAIHVRNALLHAPTEIQDRVIVVAIAPGVVVPGELCYKSFNYASKKDIVHYGELGYWGAWSSNETGLSHAEEKAMQERQELELLEPHPEATGIDHDFESPTFEQHMRDVLKNYAQQKGEYPPEKKGKNFLEEQE